MNHILICVILDDLQSQSCRKRQLYAHTSGLRCFGVPSLDRFSNRMPFSGEKRSSLFGPRPPNMPFMNCRTSSNEKMRFSTSPLARCNWYPNCGATVLTSSSVERYDFCGGSYGVHTENTCDISFGCHRTVRQITMPPLKCQQFLSAEQSHTNHVHQALSSFPQAVKPIPLYRLLISSVNTSSTRSLVQVEHPIKRYQPQCQSFPYCASVSHHIRDYNSTSKFED
jgi:hypothetical protein